jgi:hypothetical protein
MICGRYPISCDRRSIGTTRLRRERWPNWPSNSAAAWCCERTTQSRSCQLAQDVSDVSMTFDPPELPAASIAVCGENLYQAELPLEAVGQDLDGSIRPINELSYRAASNWQFADLDFMNEVTDPQARDLARATVFRWYRVAAEFVDALPSDLVRADLMLNDILPLRSEQIETLDYADIESAKPAQLFGSWYEPAQNITQENSVDSLQPVSVETDSYAKSALYRKPFDLDTARGIVMFREPVYRLSGEVGEQTIQPAQLRLRTSFTIRAPATGVAYRYERARGQAGASRAATRFVSLADVSPHWIVDYNADYSLAGVRHNLLNVHVAADDYLEFIERQVVIARPESVGYVGLKRIDLDGAIQQVTWSVGSAGQRPARLDTPRPTGWFRRHMNWLCLLNDEARDVASNFVSQR